MLFRQIWMHKSRYISIITAVFFSVSIATIALTLDVSNSDLRLVFLFSAIASIIVGMIDINQTVVAADLEAHHDHTLLLSMGEDLRDIRWTIRIQTLIMSLIGSVFGIMIGLGLTVILVPFTRAYSGVDGTDVTMDAPAWKLIVIMVSGLASGLAASWKASGDGNDEHRLMRTRVIRFSIGLVSMLVGMLLAYWNGLTALQPAIGASVLIVLGFYLVFPLLFRWIMLFIDRTTRRVRSPVFRFAIRSITVRRSNSAAVAGAFTVGVLFLAAVTIIGSWTSDADSTAAAMEYNGTLKINNNGQGSTPMLFRDSDMQAWSTMDTVKSVYSFQGQTMNVVNGSPGSKIYLYRIHTVSGGNPFDDLFLGHDNAAKAFAAGEVVVGSTDASKYGYKIGDKLTVQNADSEDVELTVGAIMGGYNAEGMFVNDSEYKITHVTSAYIVTDHSDDDAFIKDWNARYGHDYVGQNRLDRIKLWGASALQKLLIEYASASLVITMSVLGLMTMLALSILQRKRELGLLSAYGMSDSQLRLSLMIEASMMTGVSGLLATVVGTVVGIVIGVTVISMGSFPWTMIIWLVCASVIIGAVSAIVPGAVAVSGGAHELRDE
jgi:putative ABC transport system permease protein